MTLCSFACQGPDEYFRNGALPGTGGSSSSTGGTGNATGTGGSDTGTGGVVATGGILGTGGAVATGGVRATGGVTGTGGRLATGGISGGAGGPGTAGAQANGGSAGKQGGGAGTTGAGGAAAATCSGSKLCVETNCESPSTSQIGFQLDVLNNSTTGLALSDVTVRYWFTVGQPASPPTVTIDYWMYDKANITTKFVAVTPAVTGANEYLEIGFKTAAPTLPLFTDSTNIQFRIYTANYDPMLDPMPTSDYSFQKCGAGMTAGQTAVNPAPTITGYVKGVLTWGTEPM